MSAELANKLVGGRYRVVRKIAEGGMGAVFEAQHNLSKKTVALKILFPHIGKDEGARQRFLREVSAPAQIGHDNIVEVYDAGFDTEDGSLFVAMEMLDGEPLRDRLVKGGIPFDRILDIFEEILDPLSAAHAKGIVHRDMKPENVFVTKKKGREFIKILDFGIARDLDSSNTNVTHTGIAMGTPHYMAPEQAMSAKGASPAADVWALGVMMYEALAGRTPFDGETASAIVVAACTQMHPPLSQVAPQVPRPLADFVDRCLAKDPTHRPANAGQMLEWFRQVRQQIGSVSGAASASGPGAATGFPGTGAPFATGQPSAFGAQPSAFGAQPSAFGPQHSFGAQPQAFGAQPQAFGTAPPQSQPGAFGTAPPQSHPGGFGTPPPGAFGTGSPAAFGTAPAGAFGTGAPGSFSPSPGGFGTAQMQSAPGFGAPPGSFGAPSSYGAAMPVAKSGRGVGIGLIAAIAGGGLLLAIVAVIVAVVAWPRDSGGGGGTSSDGSQGHVIIETDVSTSELFVDGTSHGPVVPGQQIDLAPGSHALELRENGQAVANATVNVTAGQELDAQLRRIAGGGPGVAVNNPTGGQMLPGNVQTFSGRLQQGDETLRTGEFADSYPFAWNAGSAIHVEVNSTDFDTYVIVRAPSGQQQDNDDGGNGTNAGLDLTTAETGQYRVMVTSFSAGMGGEYQLIVRAP